MRVFSITDHDTLNAYGQFERRHACASSRGIEINTTYKDGEVHISATGCRWAHRRSREVLEANRTARRTRVGRIVAQLRDAGYEITMDDVQAEAQQGASLGRPHVGKALIRLGIAPDIETAFRSFLRRGAPGYVPSTHITPHEASA